MMEDLCLSAFLLCGWLLDLHWTAEDNGTPGGNKGPGTKSDICQCVINSQPRQGGTSATCRETEAQGGTAMSIESCRLSRELSRLGSPYFWPGFRAPNLATSPPCRSGADFS